MQRYEEAMPVFAAQLSASERELVESRARLDLATRAGKIGVWDWNLTTNEMVYSEQAKAIFGFPPGLPVSFEQVRDATHPDDLPNTSAQARRTLDPQVRAHEPYEYRIIRPDGSVRWVLAEGEAMFIDGPEVRAVRYIGTIQDITERKALLQALQASQARLALAMQVGKLALWDYVGATDTIVGSPELNVLMGFSPDEQVSSAEYRSRYAPNEAERLRELARAALERGDTFLEAEVEIVLPDASHRCLLLRADFLPSPHGRGVLDCLGIIVDITEQKQSERHRALLTRELEHRIKNTLAMVTAIINQTFRSPGSIPEIKARLNGRVLALQQAHDLLTRNNWRSTSIRSVIEHALLPHRSGEGRFRISGPDFDVAAKRAFSMTLALHELATNAVKYGSLSGDRGLVDLSWTVEQQAEVPMFRLNWRESGGPPVQTPINPGFGTKLIQAIFAGELDGKATIEFRPNGVECQLLTRLEVLRADTPSGQAS